MNLSEQKAFVQSQHDYTDKAPNRYGWLRGHDNKPVPVHNGCINSFRGNYSGYHGDKYMVFQGDGPVLPFSALIDPREYTKVIAENKRGLLEFKGTQRSLEWVKLLMSEGSPWHDMTQTLLETDPEYINNAGWLFNVGHKNYHSELCYNFAMAQRFPWECPVAFNTFLMLKGGEFAMDLFITHNFQLKQGAKNIDGPWEMIYPWSDLEGGNQDLSCAGRYIAGKPWLGTTETRSNVLRLWQTTPSKQDSDDFINLRDNPNLMLSEIYQTLTAAVDRQSKLWK